MSSLHVSVYAGFLDGSIIAEIAIVSRSIRLMYQFVTFQIRFAGECLQTKLTSRIFDKSHGLRRKKTIRPIITTVFSATRILSTFFLIFLQYFSRFNHHAFTVTFTYFFLNYFLKHTFPSHLAPKVCKKKCFFFFVERIFTIK